MHNKQQITGWLFLLLLCVAGCGQPVSKKQNTMINWTKLPDLPGAADTASLGVSAPFAGIHNGVLIVAGGCNFPDKPVTEGGAKRYYSEIFVLLPVRLERDRPTASSRRLRRYGFHPGTVSFASEETTVILPWSRSPASPITPRKER